jgi:hypothetical protein
MTWRAISAWPDHSALFYALGDAVVMQRASEGDREAHFCLGFELVGDAGGVGTPLGAARSPQADVGSH